MADDDRRAEIEAVLAAGDALADGVLRWESHVTLEGLAGTYRSARVALDRVRDARGDDETAERLRVFARNLPAEASETYRAAFFDAAELAARSPQGEDH